MSRTVLVAFAVVLTSCGVRLTTPDAARVVCTHDAECPGNGVCDSATHLCVWHGTDQRAPELAGAAELSPTVVAKGTRVALSVTFNEPLLVPPVATLDTPMATPFDYDADMSTPTANHYYFTLFPSGNEPEGLWTVSLSAMDFAGNPGSVRAGSLQLDFTPPELTDLQWDTDDVVVPRAALGFSAVAAQDTSLPSLRAMLMDDAGVVLGDISLETPVLDTSSATPVYRLHGVVELGLLVGPDHARVALLLEAADAAGNAATASTSSLDVDGTLPQVTLAGPTSPARDRRATLTFLSTDLDVIGFECRLDGAEYAPCTSPYTVEVAGNGMHIAEVRAVDLAGNVTEPPASHSWEVIPVWTRVAIGSEVVCGLGSDGSLWCWGNNSSGALGQSIMGTRLSDRAPNRVAADVVWAEVEAGEAAACGIRQDTRALWCWGSPRTGQMGVGPTGARYSAPGPVIGDGAWLSVSLSRQTACGIQVDGSLHCWGAGDYGALGQGDLETRDVPIQVGTATDWSMVSTGAYHTCGIRQGVAYCWGWSFEGRLGSGAVGAGNDYETAPVLVDGGFDDWTAISAGIQHTCGLRTGSVWCWGSTWALGTPSDVLSPTQVGNDTDWVAVEAGHDLSCGLKVDGSLWCWGRALDGRLRPNDADLEVGSAPVRVGEHAIWVAHAVGRGQVCALDAAGDLSCWGNNLQGELGLGTSTVGLSPLAVPHDDWETVVAGPFGSAGRCGIRNDRTLWCWGDGTFLDASSGGTMEAFSARVLASPQEVGGNDWLVISIGQTHRCGIRGVGPTGSLWCWGRNTGGDVGVATTTTELAQPTQVGTDADWIMVRAGRAHTCGIRAVGTDRQLYCFGSSGNGELGAEDPVVTSETPTPTRELTGTVDWTDVAPGWRYTCAIRDPGSGGQLYCWGKVNLAGPPLPVPTVVDLGDGVAWNAVVATNAERCALRGSGSLWCSSGCGFNGCQPWAPVADITDWVNLDRDTDAKCGRRASGDVWCIGTSPFAPGRYDVESVAWQVPGTWDAFDVGGGSICGLRGKELHCWGDNSKGQLGADMPWGPGWVPLPF
jgi:alpha-tubulin suppressor-like RCC1 family protein